MREFVKVRQASNGEITIAIPKEIRAVVPLKAGERVLLTARGGLITIEREEPQKRSKE